MAVNEIVVACTSLICVSLDGASVMADAMAVLADAKKESGNAKRGLVSRSAFGTEINLEHLPVSKYIVASISIF